jgi:hypothetical protein
VECVSQYPTESSCIKKYTEILIVGVEIFSESSSESECFIFDWWYNDRESFSRSLKTSEIFKKFETDFIEPSYACPFLISTESDPIIAILRICDYLREYIWT